MLVLSAIMCLLLMSAQAITMTLHLRQGPDSDHRDPGADKGADGNHQEQPDREEEHGEARGDGGCRLEPSERERRKNNQNMQEA